MPRTSRRRRRRTQRACCGGDCGWRRRSCARRVRELNETAPLLPERTRSRSRRWPWWRRWRRCAARPPSRCARRSTTGPRSPAMTAATGTTSACSPTATRRFHEFAAEAPAWSLYCGCEPYWRRIVAAGTGHVDFTNAVDRDSGREVFVIQPPRRGAARHRGEGDQGAVLRGRPQQPTPRRGRGPCRWSATSPTNSIASRPPTACTASRAFLDTWQILQRVLRAGLPSPSRACTTPSPGSPVMDFNVDDHAVDILLAKHGLQVLLPHYRPRTRLSRIAGMCPTPPGQVSVVGREAALHAARGRVLRVAAGRAFRAAPDRPAAGPRRRRRSATGTGARRPRETAAPEEKAARARTRDEALDSAGGGAMRPDDALRVYRAALEASMPASRKQRRRGAGRAFRQVLSALRRAPGPRNSISPTTGCSSGRTCTWAMPTSSSTATAPSPTSTRWTGPCGTTGRAPRTPGWCWSAWATSRCERRSTRTRGTGFARCPGGRNW